MTVGENIHNAFVVVFRTLQAIEKLIRKCRAELDTKTYYMPEERFLRHSSDSELGRLDLLEFYSAVSAPGKTGRLWKMAGLTGRFTR